MSLKDKVTVITGGSKGFGKALAQAFIKEGAIVTITGNNEQELSATAEVVGAEYLVADAKSYDNTVTVSESVIAKYGHIDIWINNAGIQIAPSNVEDVKVDRLHELIEVNYFGYFYGSKVALASMKKTGEGLIININSTAGLSGKPGLSAYVSSKFAIKGLSESIREEIKGTDIKLYQIFPGGMKTDIYREKVPEDIDQYMNVSYAIEKVIDNLKLENPEIDLVIKRPQITS